MPIEISRERNKAMLYRYPGYLMNYENGMNNQANDPYRRRMRR